MNSRERIIRTISHQEPDRIPIDIGGTTCTTLIEPVFRKLLAKYPLSDNHFHIIHSAMRSISINEEVKNFLYSDTDILCVNEPSGGRLELTNYGFIDEWGVKYRRSKVGDDYYYDIYENPLAEATIDDLETYPWPDANDLIRYQGLKQKAKELSQKNYFLMGNILESSIFEMAWYMRGFQAFLMDMISNKPFVHALLEKITSIQKTIYEKFLQETGEYLDMVFIADDLATQENLLFSPSLYREIIKPYQAEYFKIKRRNNLPLLYHCCGNIAPLLDDLIEIGVDALNPVQISARQMDPKRLKKEYGEQLCFWGGVDTQTVLNSSDSSLVKDSVKKIIDIFAPGGGFVLTSVHNIQNDVPVENIKTMVDTAFAHGVY